MTEQDTGHEAANPRNSDSGQAIVPLVGAMFVAAAAWPLSTQLQGWAKTAAVMAPAVMYGVMWLNYRASKSGGHDV